MSISVIIPTYNRAEILRKTVLAYADQAGQHQMLEVLVVDDGSKDHTASVVKECSHRFPVPLRYLHQENRGLAAARNHAIREARADLLLFGDDDIIPGRGLVAEHVSWHLRHPEPTLGMLGYVPWAPEVRPTPFMVWSSLYGPQFSFGVMKPGREVDYSHAYFCNTSLKAGFLKASGCFDERFRAYGWEDVEFSYRLYQLGWRVHYNPAAVGYHNKYETFDKSLRRTKILWLEAWPAFVKTDAGRHSLELWSAARVESGRHRHGIFRRLLRPVKRSAMPLLKLLMNSSLTFPDSVYERVWSHYSKPIVDAALDPGRGATE